MAYRKLSHDEVYERLCADWCKGFPAGKAARRTAEQQAAYEDTLYGYIKEYRDKMFHIAHRKGDDKR